MAAPNIISATTINGKAAAIALSSTSATALLSNAAASGKCLRVQSVTIANSDTVARNATLNYYSGAALGGTAFALVSVLSIPANSSLNVLAAPLYLEEDRSLGVTAGTSNTLTAVCSYEDIS